MVEHCIVQSVPISLLNQEMVYIIIFPKNTVHQDLQKRTSVNCLTQNFLALMLYVNTKTPNLKHKLALERAIYIDVEDIVGDVDDHSLREELQSCRHFLVDSEIQKGRHRVVNFAVTDLTAPVIEEKLDGVPDKLKCVAKLNLPLGFILKNIEDRNFRYFYAHENNTLLEQSKLASKKDDMAKLKEMLKKTDVIESCTEENSNTKRRFFKLPNFYKICCFT